MTITANDLQKYADLKDELEDEIKRVADIIKNIRFPKSRNMDFEKFDIYGSGDNMMIEAEYEWYACGNTDYETIQFPASYLWNSDELDKVEEHEKERRRLALIEQTKKNAEREAKQKEDRRKQYLKLKEEFEVL